MTNRRTDMKQRRIYTPPRATLLDCDGPELLANSNINFGSPVPDTGRPYSQEDQFQDNINDFQDGEDFDFNVY